MKNHLLLFLTLILTTNLAAQNLVINEVMSKNQNIIFDEFEDTPDWIELYNNSDSTIKLDEYFISDDLDELNKWQLPNDMLLPKEHYLIFASDRDIRTSVNHWETVADLKDEWKYKVGDSSIPDNWNQHEFNSSDWDFGISGFGYGDSDDNTILPNGTTSVYLIRKFNISNLDDLANIAVFNIDFDDGYVAYLNGVEIARENVGTIGVQPNYNTYADNAIEPKLINGESIPNHQLNDVQKLFVQGENILAVQVHNANANSSDLTAIPFLSIAYTRAPENARGSSDIISLPDINAHTNFKLSSDGETVVLSSDTEIIDSITIGSLPIDISYGRQPSGGHSWTLFNIPTPGENNHDIGFDGQAEAPYFSHSSQLLSSPISLELTTDDATASIYFTTNGSEPTADSEKYADPISISATTVVRAIAVEENKINSKVVTQSFIFDDSPTLPIISLSTTPANFYDYNTGIYVEGPNAENANPHFGANYWMDWEKPIHIDFFETDGSNAFSIDGGVKIFGAWSRANPQKSLALFARKRYGNDEIDYKIFPNLNIDKFKSIVLRNSGNDISYSFIRDPLMQSIVEDRDIDWQAYRPAIVYFNGEYWGIYNIREKLNEDYLESHYDVDPKNVDIIEKHGDVVEGDNEQYFKLYDFINKNDLSIQQKYEEVKTMLDINSFQDYFIAQIYYNNQDWPGNNLKYWREKEEGSKFRIFLYDTDFGFGLYNSNDYSANTLWLATTPNGSDWPNPPWSTLFLRKLLENNEFKNQFVAKFCLYLSTDFTPTKVSHTIDSLYNVIYGEMDNHCNCWGYNYNTWLSQQDVLRYFGSQRPNYCRQHLKDYFDLGNLSTVSLDQTDYSKGEIFLYNQKLESQRVSGEFFSDIPIEIMAVPQTGYMFKRWTGLVESENAKILLTPRSDIELTAEYEPYSDNDQSIIVNEINYNSVSSFDSGEWIELYNRGNANINLYSWKITDSNYNNSFIIMDDIILSPDEYLVICNDINKFKSVYPDIENVIGNFDFNLSNSSESISIYNAQGNIIDFVEYSDSDPWPKVADGKGATLSLITPAKDNNVVSNWGASLGNGTPGKVNDIINDVEENKSGVISTYKLEQNYPNPFNPVTIISYQIPHEGNVKLVIYDLLGRKVKSLVNEVQKSGQYSVTFDASQLSSGVYIYKISAKDFHSSKKMLLLK